MQRILNDLLLSALAASILIENDSARISCLAQAPPNDQCPNAVQLIPGAAPTLGTTINAGLQPWCGMLPAGFQGVWYSVVGTGNLMSLSTCTSQTSFPTDIALMWECDCPFCAPSDKVNFLSECAIGDSATNDTTAIGRRKRRNRRRRQRQLLIAERRHRRLPDVVPGAAIAWKSIPGHVYPVFVTGSTETDIGDFGIFLRDHPVPANDQCPNAQTVAVNGPAVTGTTIGSSFQPMCKTDNETEEVVSQQGVWYEVLGNGNLMSASTCTPDTTFRTALTVQLACESTQCVPLQTSVGVSCVHRDLGAETVTWQSVAGQLYRIFVTNFVVDDEPEDGVLSGSDDEEGAAPVRSAGNFGIFVKDHMPPPNDDCQQPRRISLNSEPIFGTTILSQESGWCGSDDLWNGVFYEFTGTGQRMTVTTCLPETSFLTDFSVQLGCNTTCITTFVPDIQDAGCAVLDGQAKSFDTIINQTYLLFVTGTDKSEVGDFALQVVDNAFLLCKEAVTLAIGDPIVLSTTVEASANSWCGGPAIWPGKWFEFLGNGGPLTISTCDSAATDYNLDFSLQTRCDGTDACLTVADGVVDVTSQNCGGNQGKQIQFTSTAQQSYFVFVTGFLPTDTGNFGIRIWKNEINMAKVNACVRTIRTTCSCSGTNTCINRTIRTACTFSEPADLAAKEQEEARTLGQEAMTTICSNQNMMMAMMRQGRGLQMKKPYYIPG